jgi:hypothetical protein
MKTLFPTSTEPDILMYAGKLIIRHGKSKEIQENKMLEVHILLFERIYLIYLNLFLSIFINNFSLRSFRQGKEIRGHIPR